MIDLNKAASTFTQHVIIGAVALFCLLFGTIFVVSIWDNFAYIVRCIGMVVVTMIAFFIVGFFLDKIYKLIIRLRRVF